MTKKPTATELNDGELDDVQAGQVRIETLQSNVRVEGGSSMTSSQTTKKIVEAVVKSTESQSSGGNLPATGTKDTDKPASD